MLICHVCEKEATHRFSPDLDVKGIGACNEHLEVVRMAYMLLMTGEHKEFDRVMKRERNAYKKSLKPKTKGKK